jgi:hypothetical protein
MDVLVCRVYLLDNTTRATDNSKRDKVPSNFLGTIICPQTLTPVNHAALVMHSLLFAPLRALLTFCPPHLPMGGRKPIRPHPKPVLL